MKKNLLQDLPSRYEPGVIAKLDRRKPVVKALERGINQVMNELGGDLEVSSVKRSLIERFVFLELTLERMERQIAEAMTENQDADELIGRWTQGVNALSGLAMKIGLNRSKRTITTLKSYVEGSDE